MNIGANQDNQVMRLFDTVDGWNPSPVCKLSNSLQRFYTFQLIWLVGFLPSTLVMKSCTRLCITPWSKLPRIDVGAWWCLVTYILVWCSWSSMPRFLLEVLGNCSIQRLEQSKFRGSERESLWCWCVAWEFRSNIAVILAVFQIFGKPQCSMPCWQTVVDLEGKVVGTKTDLSWLCR